jgi:hypothetical protein
MSVSGDEHLYAKVAEELESGTMDKGIWTKALSQNEFDEAKAKADYVEIRVAQMKEALAEQEREEAAEAAALEEREQEAREEAVAAAAKEVVEDYRRTVHKRGDFRLIVAAVILIAIWLIWSNC